MANRFVGKWRITAMELWDREFVDMLAPGQITLSKDGFGQFQFGAVEGQIDYRMEQVGSQQRLEFSWEGFDESDPACGRGWATMEGSELVGRLYFHMGDNSWFRATRLSS